ncbi:MAG: hypothetical protein OXB95_12375 [Rhodobacteraceae bacterium]|nr:hypothetical protein [Paracoccaceae bacterium]
MIGDHRCGIVWPSRFRSRQFAGCLEAVMKGGSLPGSDREFRYVP